VSVRVCVCAWENLNEAVPDRAGKVGRPLTPVPVGRVRQCSSLLEREPRSEVAKTQQRWWLVCILLCTAREMELVWYIINKV